MLKLDTPFGDQFNQFLDWWTGELLSIVPRRIQKLFGGAAEYLVLSRGTDGLALSHLHSTGETELVHLPPGPSGAESRSLFLQEYPALADARTALRLTGQQGLRKQFKLPMAAAENLNQVVAFELDRMTPFKSDQVYYSTVIVGRLKATRQLLVDLYLTPRAKLEALLDELAEAGWQPELVYLAGDGKPGAYNLLPDKFKPPRNRWPDIVNGTLAVVLLTLIVLLVVLPIWSARSETIRLQTEVRNVSKVAQEVDAMREESEKLLHQARFLQDKKHNDPVLVDALEELSRVIPDGTWLNGLQYGNRRLVIQGQSPSASSLIQGIETSRFFHSVSFVSPVTKDSSNGLERFQIASDVVNGRYSEKSN